MTQPDETIFTTIVTAHLGLNPPPISLEEAVHDLQVKLNELILQFEILKEHVKILKDKA